MNMVINIGAFIILTALWLGFATALVFSQSILDTVWHSFRGLPWVLQSVIWLLVLGSFTQMPLLQLAGLVMLAHSSLDRALGFGLQESTS